MLWVLKRTVSMRRFFWAPKFTSMTMKWRYAKFFWAPKTYIDSFTIYNIRNFLKMSYYADQITKSIIEYSLSNNRLFCGNF